MIRFKNYAKFSQSVVRGILALCFVAITLNAVIQPASAFGPEMPPMPELPELPIPGDGMPVPWEPEGPVFPELPINPPWEFPPFELPEFPFDPPDRVPDPTPDPVPTTYDIFLPAIIR